MQSRRRVWLLKERVRRLMRRGEKDHSLRVGGQAFDDRWSRSEGNRPHKKHRAYALRAGVERFGSGQVAVTTSTADGNLASVGPRRSARTGTPASNNRSIT
jgi:hypothetical protein